MATRRKLCIRLLTDIASGVRRELTRAIVDAASAQGCRLLVSVNPTPSEPWQDWKLDTDAVIFATGARSHATKPVLALGLPVVLLSSQRLDLQLPCVLADERRIGWLAGEHLISRGCKHFAYVGLAEHDGSALRREGFAAALVDHGLALDVALPDTHDASDMTSSDALRQQMADVPGSTGVLAFNDCTALAVLDAARQVARSVPRDIAVVGIGNDDLLCLIGNPTLSSVDADSSRIGREALAVTLKLIRGEEAGPLVRRIEPLGVVARGSTNPTAMVRHPLVRAALGRLDRWPMDEMSVDRLLNELIVSRSTLDRAFRKTLGRTAHEEIRQRRLRLARELLTETSMSGVEIASRTGFSHLSNLSAAFKAEFGVNLSAFRRRHGR